MSDVAEMMLDGTLCEGCGRYLGSNSGIATRCRRCQKVDKAAAHASVLAHHQRIKKVPCPQCGKKVKAIGLNDHLRDAHGGSQ